METYKFKRIHIYVYAQLEGSSFTREDIDHTFHRGPGPLLGFRLQEIQEHAKLAQIPNLPQAVVVEGLKIRLHFNLQFFLIIMGLVGSRRLFGSRHSIKGTDLGGTLRGLRIVNYGEV